MQPSFSLGRGNGKRFKHPQHLGLFLPVKQTGCHHSLAQTYTRYCGMDSRVSIVVVVAVVDVVVDVVVSHYHWSEL